MTEPAEPRPPVDWRRATDGIQLAGIALFLLLNTTGVLPWSFWFDALTLWPVLIMAAGLRMAVDRTRAPWLQLLSPVLILGTMAWLAVTPRPLFTAHDWKAVSVARPAGVTHLRLEGALLGASIEAQSTSVPKDMLAQGRMASRRGTGRIETPVDGETATIRVEGPRKGGFFLWVPGASDQWQLDVDESLPLTVKLGGAMSRVALDLRSLRLEHGAVEGVFLATDLVLPRPERDTEVRIAGVFNALTLSVPEGTPVRVHGPGLPFNVVDRGRKGAGPGYDVSVAGIFSTAQVLTRRAEDGARRAPAEPPAEPPAPAPTSRPPAEAAPAPGSAGR